MSVGRNSGAYCAIAVAHLRSLQMKNGGLRFGGALERLGSLCLGFILR